MDGWLRIGTKIDTKNFDSQIEHVENQIEDLEIKLNQVDAGEEIGDITKIEVQYEKLKNQLIDLRIKQEELNKADLKKLEKTMDNIGNSTSKTIKKVSKWALAVFGLRSAYMFVRQSMSTLTQYNEQLAVDIDYMTFAIASSLEPLIEKIVELVFQLLYYVNALAIAWFNVDLFANASIENFRRANKSANELKKTLAGFDEMNVINENGSASSSGVPSYDLSKIFNEEQMEKTKNFWSDIIKFWEEDIVYFIDNTTGDWDTFMSGLGLTGKGLYDTLKGLFELIISGPLQILLGAFLGDFDLIKKGWETMCSGLKNIFIGLIEIIGGLLATAFGLLKGLFLEIVGALYKILIEPIIDKVERAINTIIIGLNQLISKLNKINIKMPDWLGGGKIGFDIKPLGVLKLPRLASGGIINQPGRGVPLGIGGEVSREGVIPLTDSQAMEELGSAIGRYITINATLINQMNGRTISRELKKVQNESAFATNR